MVDFSTSRPGYYVKGFFFSSGFNGKFLNNLTKTTKYQLSFCHLMREFTATMTFCVFENAPVITCISYSGITLVSFINLI